MNHDQRITAFRDLHASGCFVMPNPWDRGSAILLASLGFPALATSSAALAFTRGVPDTPTSVGLEATLANVREVVAATDLPVNADFQAGYGETPGEVGENVGRCVEAGVAGLSIEDSTGDSRRPLFEPSEALERLRAARAAIDASGLPVVLTARCEAFLVGHPAPLETVLERLALFVEAGADCLYAPGLDTREEVAAVVAVASGKPVNVLVREPNWMNVATLGELGVRRISVGSVLARVAWRALRRAAEEMAGAGSFRSLRDAESFAALNGLFAQRTASREPRPGYW